MLKAIGGLTKYVHEQYFQIMKMMHKIELANTSDIKDKHDETNDETDSSPRGKKKFILKSYMSHQMGRFPWVS